MRLSVRIINRNGKHLIKSENNGTKRKKLGSYSRYAGNVYLSLDMPRLYGCLRGGASVKWDKTYKKVMGSFDLFEALYYYAKKR
jgi:hypothetical protein